MQKFASVQNPISALKKVQEHGVAKVVHHLARTYSKPAYDALNKLESAYVRASHFGELRARRAAAKAALLPEWAGFIPKGVGSKLVPAGTIPGTEDVRAYCMKIWKSKAAQAHATKQTYTSLLADDIRTVSGGMVADLTNHRILQDFATSPAMVAIVCDYLGEMPAIRDLTLSVTHPNATIVGSQQWHVDYAPRAHVKYYLAIDDIGEDTGPLTWIDIDTTREIRRSERHYFGRVSDEKMRDLPTQSLVGSAGTAAFLDTARCLHYGSRQSVRDRVSLVIFYDPIGNRGLSEYPTNVKLVPNPSAALLVGA